MKKEEEGDVCPVCLEPPIEAVRLVPCEHIGCRYCLRLQTTCLICRAEVTVAKPHRATSKLSYKQFGRRKYVKMLNERADTCIDILLKKIDNKHNHINIDHVNDINHINNINHVDNVVRQVPIEFHAERIWGEMRIEDDRRAAADPNRMCYRTHWCFFERIILLLVISLCITAGIWTLFCGDTTYDLFNNKFENDGEQMWADISEKCKLFTIGMFIQCWLFVFSIFFVAQTIATLLGFPVCSKRVPPQGERV